MRTPAPTHPQRLHRRRGGPASPQPLKPTRHDIIKPRLTPGDMIQDASFLETVSPPLVGLGGSADLCAPVGIDRRCQTVVVSSAYSLLQRLHGQCEARASRSRLRNPDEPRGLMEQAARIFVLVAMLPAGAGRPTEPLDHDVSLPERGDGVMPVGGQHGNGHRRGMHPSTSLRRRDALQAVTSSLAVKRFDPKT